MLKVEGRRGEGGLEKADWISYCAADLLGFAPMKADRLGDIVELIASDVLELFAFGGQALVDFDDFFGHHLMGLRRATDEKKVWPRRQPLMAIGVKPDAQHYRFAGPLLFAWFSHK